MILLILVMIFVAWVLLLQAKIPFFLVVTSTIPLASILWFSFYGFILLSNTGEFGYVSVLDFAEHLKINPLHFIGETQYTVLNDINYYYSTTHVLLTLILIPCLAIYTASRIDEDLE